MGPFTKQKERKILCLQRDLSFHMKMKKEVGAEKQESESKVVESTVAQKCYRDGVWKEGQVRRLHRWPARGGE